VRSVTAYVGVGVTNVSLAAATPNVSVGYRALVDATALSLTPNAPAVASGGSVSVPVADTSLAGLQVKFAGIQKTPVYPPSGELVLSGLVPAVSTGVSIALPVKDIGFAASVPDLVEFVKTGTAAPVLGATAATTTTGWTQIVGSTADDASIQTASFGFTFTLDSTGYTTCYVGSNGYITFSAGSSEYASLSASVPALPKVFFAPGDRSYNRVLTTTGNTSGTSYFGIRWQGTAGTSGAATTFVEIYFYAERGGQQYVEVRFGSNSTAGSTILIANASTAYASSTTTANSSWVFVGNATGTSWTLDSNRFISK
jgi:hypothetical protein